MLILNKNSKHFKKLGAFSASRLLTIKQIAYQIFSFTDSVGGFLKDQLIRNKEMKYVLVTGGVVSGLGKGVTASSIGVLLKACGLRVTSIKIGTFFIHFFHLCYSFSQVKRCFAYVDHLIPRSLSKHRCWNHVSL